MAVLSPPRPTPRVVARPPGSAPAPGHRPAGTAPGPARYGGRGRRRTPPPVARRLRRRGARRRDPQRPHGALAHGGRDVGRRAAPIGNALAHGGGWVVTWVLQVLALLFFAAGASAAYGLRRADDRTGTVARGRVVTRPSAVADLADGVRLAGARLPRLLRPVAVFVGAWVVAVGVLLAVGLPADAVRSLATLAPQLLWFLAVYLGLVVLTPLLRRALHAAGWWAVAGLAAAPLAVEALRFGAGFERLALVNVVLVWAVPYAVGLLYADARSGLRVARRAASSPSPSCRAPGARGRRARRGCPRRPARGRRALPGLAHRHAGRHDVQPGAADRARRAARRRARRARARRAGTARALGRRPGTVRRPRSRTALDDRVPVAPHRDGGRGRGRPRGARPGAPGRGRRGLVGEPTRLVRRVRPRARRDRTRRRAVRGRPRRRPRVSASGRAPSREPVEQLGLLARGGLRALGRRAVPVAALGEHGEQERLGWVPGGGPGATYRSTCPASSWPSRARRRVQAGGAPEELPGGQREAVREAPHVACAAHAAR